MLNIIARWDFNGFNHVLYMEVRERVYVVVNFFFLSQVSFASISLAHITILKNKNYLRYKINYNIYLDSDKLELDLLGEISLINHVY